MKNRSSATDIFVLLRSLPIGGTVAFRVTSDSMEPTITKGNKMRVIRVPFSSVRKQQVVVFYIAEINQIVIHRVVQVKKYARGERFLITKGDASATDDPWVVYEKDFLGVAQASL